ncbi:MAG: PucR family transcriptional regulator [Lachnospiraceae bacterium]
MSVTVEDLLQLPSLRRAKVLGGHKGLSKIVSSISVLESVDPGILIDELFPRGEYFGSEIVITGFMNILEDVEGQCANIRRMAQGGEAGLILFYVGVYLPQVDQRLIRLADELDFVLICMPEGERSLRYSEVISDVTDCIYRDRMKQESIVTEILERVAVLPSHLRSVNTLLQMLSDRTSSSLVLCDSSMRILNLAAWPRSLEDAVKQGVEACGFLPGGTWSRHTLCLGKGETMELLLLKEGDPFDEMLTRQIIDVVRLGVNIWGRRHSEVAVHELVRAILQDEPMKMRRLADIFHIRVEDIHEMWMICGEDKDSPAYLQKEISSLRTFADNCADTVVADIYEGKLLLFLGNSYSQREAQQQIQGLLKQARRFDDTMTLTRCGGLCDTKEVRRAYLCHQDYLADARQVFAGREYFRIGEIRFVESCRRLIGRGEEEAKRRMDCLKGLKEDGEGRSLMETLSVYLLDGGVSVTETAKLLYVHKNTVKYRLQRITDILGYRPDKMPEGIEIYRAAAVGRLLSV